MKRCVKCNGIIWPWQTVFEYKGDETQPQLIPGLHHTDCTGYIFEANRVKKKEGSVS